MSNFLDLSSDTELNLTGLKFSGSNVSQNVPLQLIQNSSVTPSDQ